jgi:DNA-binding NarL/FixJ family response regulator
MMPTSSMYQAGADGYLLKETSPQELKKSILEVLEGGAAMSPSIAFKTLKFLRNPQEFENRKCDEDIKLSTREIEVLEQLSRGLNYNIIAINLSFLRVLSENTQKIFIQNFRFTIN